MTMTIGVPSAIKTFNLVGHSVGRQDPVQYRDDVFAGIVSLFVTGGLSGLFLAQPSLDLTLQRYIFRGRALPPDHGRRRDLRHLRRHLLLVPENVWPHAQRDHGQAAFLADLRRVYCIFMPMHFLGLAGNPRRYADLSGVNYLAPLRPVHYFITMAAMITITAQFIFLFNFFYSLWFGEKASANPWNATTLEWDIPSPPPFDNFAGHVPVVYHGAYEFGVPGAKEDFIMQTQAPAQVGERH